MRTTFCKALLLLAGFGIGPLATAQEVVKVAFIDVLSGPFAQAGEGSLKQLREVVLQLNAKSAATDPKFEVVPLDGKGSPQESVSALKSATDRGIRYITQGGGSGVAFALVEALNRLAGHTIATAFEIQCVRRVHHTDARDDFFHRPKFGSPQYSESYVRWLLAQHERDPQFFEKAKAADRGSSAATG
jgi:hypothetical protein